MNFDVEWLSALLQGTVDVDRLADRLTACGFLVELRERLHGSEVWDVEVTTNRPDAMNHRGLAREAAVALGIEPTALDISLEEAAGADDEAAGKLASVEIVEPELCPRYVARIVRGVTIAESPDWMQDRLQRCGVRPINAVVDATNYLLLELGQPMHAFDLDLLAGRKIIVRRAREGERLTTLDEQERVLGTDDLVIADSDRAVALAGIMGGADTEISSSTTDILIESAHFDALTVRRTARRLGMHTEASHRFERGSDPEMAAVACDAAAALIASLTGGQVCKGRIDAFPLPRPALSLSFSMASLSGFAGLDIDADRAAQILDGLGFAPVVDGDHVTATVPPHRVDVERVADLYEEVIRHVGYSEVPSRLPVLSTAPGHRHANWELVDRGRRAAIGAGLTEIMTWSFIDPADDGLTEDHPLVSCAPLRLGNPLAQTQSTMRRSLLPGMLAAVRENLNQGERAIAVFEQGRVFGVSDSSPWEGERVGVVLSGADLDGTPASFGELKGAVEELIERAAFPPLQWQRGGAPWLDESEGAVIDASNGRVVGLAGRLASRLAERWDFKQPVYLAELDLDAALPTPPMAQFRPLPKHPSVAVDVTVEHAPELSYAELENTVLQLASDQVESVSFKDRYTGKELADGRVRTTLRLTYRHPDRSLTQEEVNADQERLRDGLAERLGVVLA
jgi:phenylalanyl-tRNA synthetase beta chain